MAFVGAPLLPSHRLRPFTSAVSPLRRLQPAPGSPPLTQQRVPLPAAAGVRMNFLVDLATQAAVGVAAATFTSVSGIGKGKGKDTAKGGMAGKAAAKVAGTVLSGGKGGKRRWGGGGLKGGLGNKAGVTAALGLASATGIGGRLQALNPAIKLVLCLGLDGAGFLLGDTADLAYAPIMAAALQGLFGDARVTAAGIAEESVPGKGNVPTATLAWCAERAGLLKKPDQDEEAEGKDELEKAKSELKDELKQIEKDEKLNV